MLNQSRNQLRIFTGLLTGHCHLKGHLFKLGLVNSHKCDTCKQASEMASHILHDCEALATLRYWHPGHHFISGDSEDISGSKILTPLCSRCRNATWMRSRAEQNNGHSQKCTGQLVPAHLYAILFYSRCERTSSKCITCQYTSVC